MDTTPLVIGYKRYNASDEKREPRDGRPRLPRETVQVCLGDQEVGTISLGVLVRFSRYAKETFPKPPLVPGQEQTKKATLSTPSGSIAEAANQPSTPPSKKWADSVEGSEQDELRIDSRGPTPTKKDSSASEPSEKKYFEVYIDGRRATTSLCSHSPPPPVHVVKLTILVDTYAATLAYNLTPFPHELRHEILTRLTSTPVDLKTFEYISYRLPLGDPIMTRLFTSHFEHIDAQAYGEGVADAIFAFVTEYDGENPEEPFFRRYNNISRSREFKQRQAKRDQKKGERFDSLRGEFESFAGADALIAKEDLKKPAASTAEASAGSSSAKTPELAADEQSDVKQLGRRRGRRSQQKKGKAKAADK